VKVVTKKRMKKTVLNWC